MPHGLKMRVRERLISLLLLQQSFIIIIKRVKSHSYIPNRAKAKVSLYGFFILEFFGRSFFDHRPYEAQAQEATFAVSLLDVFPTTLSVQHCNPEAH